MGVGTEGLPEVRPPTPGRLTQSREVGRSGIKYVINREAVGLILCRQAGVTFFLSGRGPGPQSCSQRCHWPLRSLLSVATDTVGEEIGSEGADWDPPAASQSGGSRLLCLASVLLEFGVHDFECGQEIAKEEDEECECQHEHLGRGACREGQCQGPGRQGREKRAKTEEAVRAPIGPLAECPPCPRTHNPLSASYPKTAGFAHRWQSSGPTG